jgi:hypothetical protein
LHYQTRDEVIKCCEKGLREIIFVVGNDDDMSEITFAPLDPDVSRRSARETKAVEEAESFSAGLGRYWERLKVACPLPTVKVTVAQRKPLQNFSLFPRLPMEIQLMIWSFATVNYPIVRTIFTDDEN